MPRKDMPALMRHVLKTKQQRFRDAVRSAFDDPSDVGNVRMTETRIYVGLNDAETRRQNCETEKCLAMLKDVCRKHHVAFSVDTEQGGYYHEDGAYTEETSLVLILIDAERETVRSIAEELRTVFRQESVLVTEDRIGGYYLDGTSTEKSK